MEPNCERARAKDGACSVVPGAVGSRQGLSRAKRSHSGFVRVADVRKRAPEALDFWGGMARVPEGR